MACCVLIALLIASVRRRLSRRTALPSTRRAEMSTIPTRERVVEHNPGRQVG